ncbi:MAG: MoxR family ATPase [Clostridiales bacterium]|nr:MoxR family ATPase [Clostridiales bacterium]
MVTEKDVTQFSEQCKEIFAQIERDVIGQKEVVEGTIIAMIAGGNVLLEGVPGVGKTRLVRSLGRVFNLPFSRIQFTPDLMPADVTGTNIVVKDEKGNSTFQFQPGPVFSNIILADEINRATPKTQSALLEAMQEHTVTVMGVSRKLNEPFFVLATQNPIEQDGTYPLPEAQMDRFMFKLIVKNPSLDELMDIVNMTQKTMAEVANAACDGEGLLQMRTTANAIPVAEPVMRYAMTLCSATHPDSECASEAAKKYVRLGASPRAGQALISAAKVRALLSGRFNVSYNDLHELAYPVLRHRLKLNFEAIAQRVSADDIIKMIIDETSKKYDIASPAKATATASEQPAQEQPAVEAADDANAEATAKDDKKKSKRRKAK